MKNNSDGTIYNLFWKFCERFSTQITTLVVSIVLARILTPNDYGVVATVMIFISIANVFVTDGLGNALIQKRSADELDYSSVLCVNVVFSAFLYVVLYFLAPLISDFYGNGYELLTPILRVLGLRLIFSSINSVQQAYLSKNMLFKKAFFPSFLSTAISGVIGILMAYKNFGVWSIVAQNLSNTIICTIVLQFSIGKIPKIRISLIRLKGLIAFGYKMLLTGLMMCGFEQLRAIIIGKKYSSSDLAYYDRGNQFPSLLVNNINNSISAVLFPKMSLMQDSVEKLKEYVRKSIQISSYIMFPLLLGLAAISDTLVVALLTEKWLPSVPLLRLFCVYYLFMPIHSANMQAIKALGKASTYMFIEIIKKIIEFVVLLITMQISVYAMVLGMTMCATLFVFVNAYPNIKLINFSAFEMLKDIIPSLLSSLLMAVLVYIIGFLNINIYVLLFLQILAGILIYFVISLITKNKIFAFLVNRLKSGVRK